MKRSRRLFSAVTVVLATFVCLGALAAAQSPVYRSLPRPDSSNFRPVEQITKANVGQLQVAWHYPYGASIFSPVYARDVLYGFGRNNTSIVALDATTGKEIWIHDGLSGINGKGMNYWESEDGKDRRLIFSVNSFLQEIDAATGKTIPTFGVNGIVDLRQGLLRAEGTGLSVQPASPGRIWRNTLILGGQAGEAIMTPPGDIRAYDVVTGKLLWQFHTIPRPGEFGYETNPPDGWKYMGGANNWGEMALDEERGIVYIPTGSATADFWGGDRHGQNLFANCLLALDVRTGKRLWHFQTIHHDLWDLDNVSAPQLVTVTHNGQKVDVVAHAGKTGFLYVFNRVTGEPLWPIEERPVAKSDVPYELSSPTQPFPTKPAAFARQSFTADDINPHLLTKEQYDALKARMAVAINGTGPQGGLFNRTALGKDSVSMPGNQGGSNWGTTAADPERGMVFVTGVNQVALLVLTDVQNPPTEGRGGRGGNQLSSSVLTTGQRAFQQYCAACHGADQRGAIAGVPSLVGVTDRIDGEATPDHRQRGAQQHARDHRRHQRGDCRDLHVARADESDRTRLSDRGRHARRRRAPAGAGRRERRRAPAAVAGAIRRPVLSRSRRHGWQQAVAGRCGGREAADALPVRIQRDGHVDQTAVHDDHGLRSEHRRDQMAGAERRRSGNGRDDDCAAGATVSRRWRLCARRRA